MLNMNNNNFTFGFGEKCMFIQKDGKHIGLTIEEMKRVIAGLLGDEERLQDLRLDNIFDEQTKLKLKGAWEMFGYN